MGDDLTTRVDQPPGFVIAGCMQGRVLGQSSRGRRVEALVTTVYVHFCELERGRGDSRSGDI